MMKMDVSVNVINMISYMINTNRKSNNINSYILYKDQSVQTVRCKLIKITTGRSLCD